MPFGREKVLHYTASAEGPSEHPLMRAIVGCAEEEEVAVSSAEGLDAIAGGRVEACVVGRELLIGKPALLQDRGVKVREAEEARTREEEQGRTAILLAVGGELAGPVAIADALKPDAKQSIRRTEELLSDQAFEITGEVRPADQSPGPGADLLRFAGDLDEAGPVAL